MTPHVRIFDTTLRDGEQAPGCSMSPAQKLAVARQLTALRVDVIESGFPASSTTDFDAVAAIARAVGVADGPVICGLARATEEDIRTCARALAGAQRRRIHVFLATSDIHLEHKLRLSRRDALERVKSAIGLARRLCDDVEFSAEDAARSDVAFLCEVAEVAIGAGASTINIPDTVGYAMPWEYEALIRRIVALSSSVVVSTHCHDDLGLAVANSLVAVRGGARQVECTINGIGERAGNAALEEVVMALTTRASEFPLTTRINTMEIARASQLVAECTGVHPPPNKAVVGANAFAHEAGIHQDGVLKHRSTYEIITAESVGRTSRLVLGKHSGRGALRRRIDELGFRVSDPQLRRLSTTMKQVASGTRGGTIDDAELRRIANAAGASASPRSLFEKVWDAHVVMPQSSTTPAALYVDLHLVHEVTSPQAFAELRSRGLRVRQPSRTVATMDHSTPTTPGLPVLDDAAGAQLRTLAANCGEFGIQLYQLGDDRQGIVHVIGPELGLTRPGMTIVCGDSHTSTHGAFGALAFGIGTSQVAHVLATQCLLQQRPRTMRVEIQGRVGSCVTAKDIILALIAQIGTDGATEHVVEYAGDVVKALSMEERMTICNMSIEAGARAGMIGPDETTWEYLVRRSPRAEADDATWRALRSDDDAAFDRT
ncbi:MAG TPA: 2-isopropylmalate synthase, partial [Gemmatimonadaceae bacterium]|nr:2-isopropylmalate synthase [Gemmatimonadaceae bacterium]